MKLWTIQPFTLYEKLMQTGTLQCDPENVDFWGFEFDNFRSAYDWIVEQMKIRIGQPPEGVQYPFWAWALVDGKNRKPDLRRTIFNNYIGEYVLIELEIPESDILLSDEENWYYVLNNWYLHDVNCEEEDWEESRKWFYSLPSDEQQSMKISSWEQIFDKDSPENDWKYVQATFWELKAEQVKGIQRMAVRKRKTKP